jgi:predicted deacylase
MTKLTPIKRIDLLPEIHDLPFGNRYQFSLKISTMSDGTTIFLPVNVLVGERNGPELLMIAGVHGNEYEGILTQLELWEELSPKDISGIIVMIPVANPPAFRAAQRRNPEDGIDMNRIFPGRPDGNITEKLAFTIYHQIACKADIVLSMHGWTDRSLVVPYVEYPRESPVSEASMAMARAFGFDYIEAFDWPAGLLVNVCTQAGIPAIEAELGGLAISTPENRELYNRGVKNLLRYLNMLPGKQDTQEAVHQVTRNMLFAETGGILRQFKRLSENVRKGEIIAAIYGLNGEELVSCKSPGDGFMAAQLLGASVNPGDLIAVVFALKG